MPAHGDGGLRRRSAELAERPQHALHLATPPPLAVARGRRPLALALAALLFLACATLLAPRLPSARGRPDCTPATAAARAAFYGDAALSRQFNHSIVTSSPAAQLAFNRGLLLFSGFHSAAALAAFRAAADLDPAAALPHCGVALALGPGGNRAALDDDVADGEVPPFPAFRPADAPAATAAALECRRLAAAALAANPDSPIASRDADWADAVAARFAPGTERGAARTAADTAFADRMDAVAAAHADADAAALAADARVATRAWDYRDKATGTLLPHAAAAAASARAALAVNPAHPLALHILIHLHETGRPARCGEAADPPDVCASDGETVAGELAGPGPWHGARAGHLLHMPAHVFSRVGFYRNTVLAGLAAVAADQAAGAACVEAYAVEHNAQSLAAAAAAIGDARAAAVALRALARAPFHGGPAMAYAGGTVEVTTALFHAIMEGDWPALERAPRPDARARTGCLAGGHQAATLVWALGRAMAACARADRAAASGRPRDAAAVQSARAVAAAAVDAVAAAAADVPPDLITLPGPPPGLYACNHRDMATAAVAAAQARLAVVDGAPARAAALLAPAVAITDGPAAPYFEPSRHPWPLAPCLGWAWLRAGDAAAAEAAFRADLAARPSHPRGLLGLALAREAVGDVSGAADARAAANRRWAGRRPLTTPCAAFSEF